jgi:hemoglobin
MAEIGKAQTTIYERIGGETVIRRLVDRFYDLMDSAPEAAGIRALHPAELTESRDKLYWFLVGWMGGPPLYIQRFGHPRLRARHLPFPIGERERDQWLWCMFRALEEIIDDAELRQQLAHSLAQTADFMRNQ